MHNAGFDLAVTHSSQDGKQIVGSYWERSLGINRDALNCLQIFGVPTL